MGFNPNQLIRRTFGFVPDGVYTVLIHSVTIGPSRKDNPMATLDNEVISPQEVAALNGQNQVILYATAHTKFRTWWTLQLGEYLKSNLDKLVSMGVQLEENYEGGPNEMIARVLEQLPSLLSRKYVEASLSTRPQYAYRPLTAKQAAEGREEGDIIIDPVTKQPRVLRFNIDMRLEGVISGPSDETNPY